MKKLTAIDKKKITLDWNNRFEEYSVYKPMWLMRRAGLFIQGILLERDSSNTNYLPTAHLFNLARSDAEFISLSLPSTLRNKKNAEIRVGINRHESDLSEIVNEFISQAPLPMSGALKSEQIMYAYKSYLKSGLAQVKYPYHEWYDMGCLMVWCNQLEEVNKLVTMYEKEIKNWPDSLMKYQGDRIQQKLSWLKMGMENREDFLGAVSRNIELLKLEAIHDVGLVCNRGVRV